MNMLEDDLFSLCHFGIYPDICPYNFFDSSYSMVTLYSFFNILIFFFLPIKTASPL